MNESRQGPNLAMSDEGAANSPAVVLAHSLGATRAIWNPVAAALVANGFRVIRYDLRGHGESDVIKGPYSVADFGGDLLSVIVAAGLDRAHVVGLSVGGMAAMWLAANMPGRVDRLVLANTTPFIPAKERWDPLITQALSDGLDGIAAPMIEGWLSAGFRQDQPNAAASLVEAMRTTPPAGFAGTCAILRDVDLRDDLARIAAPTLILHGVEDARGAPASAALNAGIAGSVKVDIPGAAHLSPAENPAAVARAILEFLA